MERRIYALDRIEELSPTLENSPQPAEEQIKKWLDDDGLSIWLPSPDAETQSVKIHLSGYALSHFQAHPIHPTQAITEESNGDYLLTLEIRDLTGLMLLLRRFSSDVEVLEPEDLRHQMIADLQESLSRYHPKE